MPGSPRLTHSCLLSQRKRYIACVLTIHAWSGLWVAPGIRALAPALPYLILWEAFWKGLALWHSARREQAVWFVVLIVVNTVGILPIVYLFAVARLKLTELFSKKT
jgi:hypothetical protein